MRKTGRIRKRVALVIVAAMLASLAVVPAPAMAAAGTFTGGPDQYPVYVPNDHTPIAVHFTADGSTIPTLSPSTSYYLKVRFTVGTAPAGTTNRGFTWNPGSPLHPTPGWVQEREDWSSFPVVTTDANGNIANNSGWAFVKFGDDTKSGTYHLMISLSSTGDAATFNGSIVPTVTVYDPRVSGSWVHNGIAVAANKANKNVRVTDEASSTILSLQKSEANLVDDDSNLVVDDEDYGPVGNAADFRMAVPATSTIKVNLNQAFWPSATSTFTPGPADTDIALGATDTVAPSTPGALTVASGDGTAAISWTAATDNTAVTGYHVYRWTPAPFGAAYSPVHTLIATLGGDATSFSDSGLTNGTHYLYELRAFDAATNSGPRSGPVTASPVVQMPQSSVSPADPDGNEGWYVTAPVVTLAASAPGRTTQYTLESTPSTWITYTAPVTMPEGVSKITFRDTDGVTASDVGHLDFTVDTTHPTATVSAPLYSVLVSTTRSYRINWGGADAGSGIAREDVQYKSGAAGNWTPYLSGAATSTIFTGAAGSTYYFRVRSTDVAGNVSAWVESNSSAVPFDQTKASFSHSWSTFSSSVRYLGSAKYTTHSGAYANFSLTKGVLYLVTTTGAKNGKVKVYYRGHYVTTIDTYSKTTKYRQVFKLATYSKGSGASTVKLVNQATHNRPRLEIDGFALRS
jgi:hypothetical protein